MNETLRKALVHFLHQLERGDLVEDLLLVSIDWGDDTPRVTDDRAMLNFQGKEWPVVFTNSELVLRREMCRFNNKHVILIYPSEDEFDVPRDIRARAYQGRSCRLGLRHRLYALTGQDWPSEVDYAEWRPTVERHLDALTQEVDQGSLNLAVSRSDLEKMLVKAAFGLSVKGQEAPKLLASLMRDQRRSPQAPTDLALSLLRGQLRLHQVESAEALMWASRESGRAEELIRTGLMMGAEEAARRMPNWGPLNSLRAVLVGERRMPERDAVAHIIGIATSALSHIHHATQKSIVDAAQRELIDVLPEDTYNPWFPALLEREVRHLARRLAGRNTEACARVGHLRDHLFADRFARRIDTLSEMARLVEVWDRHSAGIAALDTTADWASWYALQGTRLDLTALKLMRSCQRGTELDEVIQRLLDGYWAWRDDLNLTFSRRFVDSYEAAIHDRDAGVFGTHRILEWIARPLLSAGDRVVLVIMDGMGFASFHHLLEQWEQQKPAVYPVHPSNIGEESQPYRPGTPPRAVVSLLPSVTSVSRKAIFLDGLPTDRLDDEEAYQEKARANEVQALRDALPRYEIKLYDKSNIDGGKQIIDDIQFQGADLIAVILNPIDDDLTSTATEIRLPTLDDMGPLTNIVRAALDARWKVVITADHGHTWHRDKGLRRGDIVEGGGHRFAPIDSEEDAPEDAVVTCDPHIVRVQDGDEVALLTATGSYFGRIPRRGYHGGAALEEVVVPCAFLTYEKPSAAGTKEDLTSESSEPISVRPDAYDLTGVVLTLQTGEVHSLDLPFSPSPREVRLLQALAQMGEASEADLKKALGTRRVSGALSALREKLAAEGLDYIEYRGAGARGAIYRFRAEMLD